MICLQEISDEISISTKAILSAANRVKHYIKPCHLNRPNKRPREIVTVHGPVRHFQEGFLRRFLITRSTLPDCCHGGVQGRSIVTNANIHTQSRWIYKCDITDCFPSIHYTRVIRLFSDTLGFDRQAAEVCAKLTTFDHCLAQGLITSPFLANLILAQIDARIQALCSAQGLRYSRFVDDLAISGDFDLKSGTIPKLIETILKKSGFRLRPDKKHVGRIDRTTLTNLRVGRGRIRVPKNYIDEIRNMIQFANSLSRGDTSERTFYTREQVLGRIVYVDWVTQRQHLELWRSFNRIDWNKADETARRLKLLVPKSTVVPRNRPG